MVMASEGLAVQPAGPLLQIAPTGEGALTVTLDAATPAAVISIRVRNVSTILRLAPASADTLAQIEARVAGAAQTSSGKSKQAR